MNEEPIDQVKDQPTMDPKPSEPTQPETSSKANLKIPRGWNGFKTILAQHDSFYILQLKSDQDCAGYTEFSIIQTFADNSKPVDLNNPQLHTLTIFRCPLDATKFRKDMKQRALSHTIKILRDMFEIKDGVILVCDDLGVIEQDSIQ